MYTKQHNFKGLLKRTKRKKYSEIQAHNQFSNQWAYLILHEKRLQNRSVFCRKRYRRTVLQDALRVPLWEALSTRNSGVLTQPSRGYRWVRVSWTRFWLFTEAVVTRKSRICLSGLAVLYSLFLSFNLISFTLLTKNSPLTPFFSSNERIKLKSAVGGPWTRRRMWRQGPWMIRSCVLTSNWTPSTEILQESYW